MVILNTKEYPVDSNVVDNHSYVLLGYNASTKTFTLFNPWGVNGGTTGGAFKPGTIQLTAAQLAQDMASWDWMTQ